MDGPKAVWGRWGGVPTSIYRFPPTRDWAIGRWEGRTRGGGALACVPMRRRNAVLWLCPRRLVKAIGRGYWARLSRWTTRAARAAPQPPPPPSPEPWLSKLSKLSTELSNCRLLSTTVEAVESCLLSTTVDHCRPLSKTVDLTRRDRTIDPVEAVEHCRTLSNCRSVEGVSRVSRADPRVAPLEDGFL